MELEKFLFTPGIKLEEQSQQYQKLFTNLQNILEKMLSKLRSLAYTQTYDFSKNDLKMGFNETFLGG